MQAGRRAGIGYAPKPHSRVVVEKIEEVEDKREDDKASPARHLDFALVGAFVLGEGRRSQPPCH